MARIIGLTGGIASGKTTVSAYLTSQGYPVLDADQLVHDLQAKGGRLYEALVGHFGQGILLDNGQLNRSRLAELIFASPDGLALSARLQDPIIKEEVLAAIERLTAQHEVVVLDIPLLFEKGYEAMCDETWLVVVDEATQLSRLMARNGYNRQEAQQRIASQLPLADKVRLADRLIDNSGNLDQTYQQVQQLLDQLG